MKALLRMYYYMVGGLIFLLLLTAYPLLLVLLMILLPFGTKDITALSMLILNIGVYVGIMQFNSERAEAASRWRTYAKTLPYSRRQQVDAKYLFSLLAAGLTSLSVAAAVTLLILLRPDCLSEYPYAPSAAYLILVHASFTAAIVLLFAAISYPLHFRRSRGFGTYAAAAVTGLLFFAAPFYVFMRFNDGILNCKWEPMTSFSQSLPFLLLCGAVVCYLLSWVFSRKIYCREKRRKSA